MKTGLLICCLIFSLTTVNAQITNSKAGNWSDTSIWSGNAIPGTNEEVMLNFDMVIDINATCALLNSNGYQVTVNAGVNLLISGSAADTLLSRYAEVDASGGVILDTARTIDFLYDSLKRNTVIDDRSYISGALDYEYYTEFFYNAASRLPFKKIQRTLFSNDPFNITNSTNFYTYQGDQLLVDSAEGNGTYIGVVTHYTYLPGTILRAHYNYNVIPATFYVDSALVTYVDGNITRQISPVTSPVLNDYSFVYDNHPNPFYHTQFKMIFSYSYPLYSFETFVEEIFAKNNATSIYEVGDYIYSSNQGYEYKLNGYPKKLFDPSVAGVGFAVYYYTH